MTSTIRPMLTVGERLNIARTRAGVKVGQMALVLDRHRNMVTAYESSDDVPLWVIRAYADTLQNGTTVEWLVAEVGEPPGTKLRPNPSGPAGKWASPGSNREPAEERNETVLYLVDQAA